MNRYIHVCNNNYICMTCKRQNLKESEKLVNTVVLNGINEENRLSFTSHRVDLCSYRGEWKDSDMVKPPFSLQNPD